MCRIRVSRVQACVLPPPPGVAMAACGAAVLRILILLAAAAITKSATTTTITATTTMTTIPTIPIQSMVNEVSCPQGQFKVAEFRLTCNFTAASTTMSFLNGHSIVLIVLPAGTKSFLVNFQGSVAPDLDLRVTDTATGRLILSSRSEALNQAHNYNEYDMELVLNRHDDIMTLTIDKSTRELRLDVDVFASAMALVSFAYLEISPCPAVVPGCSPCNHYVGCELDHVAECGGGGPPVCVPNKVCEQTQYQTHAIVTKCAGGSNEFSMHVMKGQVVTLLEVPAGLESFSVVAESIGKVELHMFDAQYDCYVGRDGDNCSLAKESQCTDDDSCLQSAWSRLNNVDGPSMCSLSAEEGGCTDDQYGRFYRVCCPATCVAAGATANISLICVEPWQACADAGSALGCVASGTMQANFAGASGPPFREEVRSGKTTTRGLAIILESLVETDVFISYEYGAGQPCRSPAPGCQDCQATQVCGEYEVQTCDGGLWPPKCLVAKATCPPSHYRTVLVLNCLGEVGELNYTLTSSRRFYTIALLPVGLDGFNITMEADGNQGWASDIFLELANVGEHGLPLEIHSIGELSDQCVRPTDYQNLYGMSICITVDKCGQTPCAMISILGTVTRTLGVVVGFVEERSVSLKSDVRFSYKYGRISPCPTLNAGCVECDNNDQCGILQDSVCSGTETEVQCNDVGITEPYVRLTFNVYAFKLVALPPGIDLSLRLAIANLTERQHLRKAVMASNEDGGIALTWDALQHADGQHIELAIAQLTGNPSALAGLRKLSLHNLVAATIGDNIVITLASSVDPGTTPSYPAAVASTAAWCDFPYYTVYDVPLSCHEGSGFTEGRLHGGGSDRTVMELPETMDGANIMLITSAEAGDGENGYYFLSVTSAMGEKDKVEEIVGGTDSCAGLGDFCISALGLGIYYERKTQYQGTSFGEDRNRTLSYESSVKIRGVLPKALLVKVLNSDPDVSRESSYTLMYRHGVTQQCPDPPPGCAYCADGILVGDNLAEDFYTITDNVWKIHVNRTAELKCNQGEAPRCNAGRAPTCKKVGKCRSTDSYQSQVVVLAQHGGSNAEPTATWLPAGEPKEIAKLRNGFSDFHIRARQWGPTVRSISEQAVATSNNQSLANAPHVDLYLITWEEKCEDTCVGSDGVPITNNGECDDGSAGSDHNYCDLGTDCADCGIVADPVCVVGRDGLGLSKSMVYPIRLPAQGGTACVFSSCSPIDRYCGEHRGMSIYFSGGDGFFFARYQYDYIGIVGSIDMESLVIAQSHEDLNYYFNYSYGEFDSDTYYPPPGCTLCTAYTCPQGLDPICDGTMLPRCAVTRQDSATESRQSSLAGLNESSFPLRSLSLQPECACATKYNEGWSTGRGRCMFGSTTSCGECPYLDTCVDITTVVGNGLHELRGDCHDRSRGTCNSAQSASLAFPGPIALDSEDNMFIADYSNNRIRMVDQATNTVTTVAGTGELGFTGDNGPGPDATMRYPEGIAIKGSGSNTEVWFSDFYNQRIRMLSLNETGVWIITTAIGNGVRGSNPNCDKPDGCPVEEAVLNYPRSLAFSSDSVLYIVDSGNLKIRQLSVNGIFSTFIGAGAKPKASFDYLISEYLAGHFRVLNRDVTFRAIYTLQVDNSDNLWYVDPSLNRIMMSPLQTKKREWWQIDMKNNVATYLKMYLMHFPSGLSEESKERKQKALDHMAAWIEFTGIEEFDLPPSEHYYANYSYWRFGSPGEDTSTWAPCQRGTSQCPPVPAQYAHFYEIMGICFDAADNLFLADRSASQINMIRKAREPLVHWNDDPVWTVSGCKCMKQWVLASEHLKTMNKEKFDAATTKRIGVDPSSVLVLVEWCLQNPLHPFPEDYADVGLKPLNCTTTHYCSAVEEEDSFLDDVLVEDAVTWCYVDASEFDDSRGGAEEPCANTISGYCYRGQVVRNRVGHGAILGGELRHETQSSINRRGDIGDLIRAVDNTALQTTRPFGPKFCCGVPAEVGGGEIRQFSILKGFLPPEGEVDCCGAIPKMHKDTRIYCSFNDDSATAINQVLPQLGTCWDENQQDEITLIWRELATTFPTDNSGRKETLLDCENRCAQDLNCAAFIHGINPTNCVYFQRTTPYAVYIRRDTSCSTPDDIRKCFHEAGWPHLRYFGNATAQQEEQEKRNRFWVNLDSPSKTYGYIAGPLHEYALMLEDCLAECLKHANCDTVAFPDCWLLHWDMQVSDIQFAHTLRSNVVIKEAVDWTVQNVVGKLRVHAFTGEGSSRNSESTWFPVRRATLFRPSHCTVDTRGNLIIADTWNNRIRKIRGLGNGCIYQTNAYTRKAIDTYLEAVALVENSCSQMPDEQLESYKTAQQQALSRGETYFVSRSICEVEPRQRQEGMPTPNLIILCVTCKRLAAKGRGWRPRCPQKTVCNCNAAIEHALQTEVYLRCPRSSAYFDVWHRWLSAYITCWLRLSSSDIRFLYLSGERKFLEEQLSRATTTSTL